MAEDTPSMGDLLQEDQVRAISRRYFISNGFDGALTSIGVAVGAYLSGVPTGLAAFQIGIGAAVGLGTSGVWSVWEIERAEQEADLQRIERAMLTDLEDTEVARRRQGARRVHAVMSGIGPLLGVVIPMLAFLLEAAFLTLLQSTLLAIGLGVGLLFLFGAYMGNVSGHRWWVSGIRMGLAGLVVAAVNWLLPGT